jgi:O-antigen/teichoic acid export membrane protein
VRETTLGRLGADAALVLASRLLAAVALLALTPLIVAQLGKDAYGVWIVASAATGLVGLVDVGIAPAVSRVVAARAARGEHGAVGAVASTAALTSVALNVPLIAAGWLLAPLLAGLLDVPAALHHDATSALRLVAFTFCATTLAAVYEGVLIGLRRFHALFAVRVTYVAGFVAGALAALRADAGVVALVASQAAAMVLALVVGLAVCGPAARPSRRRAFSRPLLRELLRFGLPQQGTRIAFAGAMHYERLLVGVLVGAAAAAEYGAASTVVAALGALLAQASIVLVPALTRVHAHAPAELEQVFRRAATAFTAVAAGAFGALAAVASPAIAGWLGEGFGASARSLQILAVGFLLWAVANAGFALVQALGRPTLEVRGAAVVVLVNVTVTTTLLVLAGSRGIAFGTSAALALGAVVFWATAAARVPQLHGWVALIGRPLALAALLAAVLALANGLLVPVARMDRLADLALAAGEAGLFAAAYAAGLVRLGVVPRDWRARLSRRRAPVAAAATDPKAV